MQKLIPSNDLRQRILNEGCYGPKKNTEIYEKWFARGPRGRMQHLIRKYGLSEKAVADVGCGYGNNLAYFGAGSYGIEIAEHYLPFVESIGLRAYQRDFLEDDLGGLPKAEAVVCYAVLEHVDSPHTALRKLHQLLRPGGLAIIYVPTVPALRALSRLPRIGRYFAGHTHGDHINAFTPATLSFMAERAGFSPVETSAGLPGIGRIFDRWPFTGFIDGAVFVGRKIDGWEYPPQSCREARPDGKGFTLVGYGKRAANPPADTQHS